MQDANKQTRFNSTPCHCHFYDPQHGGSSDLKQGMRSHQMLEYLH